ncbi:hypothetical protein [Methylobacterium oxalidis]|uniref:Uncharacterized protein n=1 Tax=Methylobacterium oxalidis TaxID=944322 RepID=A0A512JB77_9HYPH|nr:hypothetical protein [Methylobacterium oxalidis]GEP07254.1 hypothetical protein MOX02_52920 [Methylobacterium oxalidis]GJE32596.1 hypothetical protein LDDCCGHA_2784 [Methylobacterium oxalidis]GLS63802.1 hypothetical protein GCM10007888_21830 [Methylobacterium oxalidis]
MSTFQLHRGWREPDGLVTNQVTSEQAIGAATASDAVSAALGAGDFLVVDKANLAWLTNEQGSLIWSLRLDDDNPVSKP